MSGDLNTDRAELHGLPPEVQSLVHVVDQMRDGWTAADSEVRDLLWCHVHTASEAVWNRLFTDKEKCNA
ncbi:hypothetical protein ACIQNU_04435 [Streptomyces sp. NPDC091292]|uniref:hypothetical protein n=1 Tax=Streptomyces sp. NPDC091292 TaxID=3365991 RepID=UPI00380C8974